MRAANILCDWKQKKWNKEDTRLNGNLANKTICTKLFIHRVISFFSVEKFPPFSSPFTLDALSFCSDFAVFSRSVNGAGRDRAVVVLEVNQLLWDRLGSLRNTKTLLPFKVIDWVELFKSIAFDGKTYNYVNKFQLKFQFVVAALLCARS